MQTERMSKTANRQSITIATVAASCLMLVFGVAYRVLAARLEAPLNTAPISPAVLARLSLKIDDWTGQDVPLDEATVRATDTDAHVNRRYSRRNGLESLSLYVASGIKARDLMPHRPEVCYTGAGWTLVGRRLMELPIDDRIKLPCNVLQFSRGALNTQKIVVLDYYIVDGQYCADVSLLRSKAWRGSGTVRYVAQVQIVTSITAMMTNDSAARLVSEFAVDSASSIAHLFENPKESQNLN